MREGSGGGDRAAVAEAGAGPLRATGRGSLWPYGAVAGWYVLVAVLTRSSFQGDTFVYAADIAAGSAHRWEFGHLLWRPFGAVAYAVMGPLAHAVMGPDRLAAVTVVLEAMGRLCGLGASLALLWLLLKTCRNTPVAVAGAAAFVVTHTMVQYAPSGTAYVAGVMCLAVGMALLVEEPGRPAPAGRSALAGCALALAVLVWLPFVLAIPAALLVPAVTSRRVNGGWRTAGRAAATLCAVVVLTYGVTGTALGLRTPAAWRAWAGAASHGITHNKGVMQMVLGFPRSLIDMGGGEGVVFRRYAVHDPLNPVGKRELLRTVALSASTWKFLLFYLSLGAAAVVLARRPAERRYIGLMAAAFVPVLAFAVDWQGGDLERYLPLYPVLFVCCGRAAALRPRPRVTQALLACLVVAGLASSLVYGNRLTVNAQEAAVTARLAQVEEGAPPGSLAFITHAQPEFEDIAGRFPRNPYSLHPRVPIRALVSIGTSTLPQWRRIAAQSMLSALRAGGDVYLSTWALSSVPKASWLWVEGADPRVRWRDIYDFASRLQTGRRIGGELSFVRVLPSPANRRFLQGLCR